MTRAQLRDVDVAHMYALYSTCYRDTEQARFEHDLDDKTHCVIMRDDTGKLRGFSTLKLYEQQWCDTTLRILFSGDTIVDPACWGSQQLAFCWIRLAGELKRNSPDRALYWFLICKGHRTYRYLRAFAHDFTPRFDRPAEPLRQALLDHLAVERFGHAYDAASGVLNFLYRKAASPQPSPKCRTRIGGCRMSPIFWSAIQNTRTETSSSACVN